ncbi:glutamate racemase [Muricauda sp. 2012CJ35-5]|uniref:Glutamate racemase n=1 Tax=Flagellimonas spongiicola TaxID=2942208 RepID=A0ABT0PUB0_9FLAO|nr:glutamate racemase [Allomuricauda spongiicola]MCL6274980.1 glutamate racemase [Allomuricauda spongiicola]
MTKPIGFFDSGVGGTSIWKEVHQLLPSEDTIYLADSANAPYGARSKEEILRLSIKNTEILLKHDCKLIVVACNTATTNAIAYLRVNYQVPFIGIEPAIKPAALQTNTKKVGILATKGTLSSSLFFGTSKMFAAGIEVLEQEGTGLVELIEAGKVNSDETKELLKTYLQPMLDEGIDHLVLGCTHYPYLIPVLRQIVPNTVVIIDSGEAVARQTKAILEQNGLLASLRPSQHTFFSNAEFTVLEQLVGGGNTTVKFLQF